MQQNFGFRRQSYSIQRGWNSANDFHNHFSSMQTLPTPSVDSSELFNQLMFDGMSHHALQQAAGWHGKSMQQNGSWQAASDYHSHVFGGERLPIDYTDASKFSHDGTFNNAFMDSESKAFHERLPDMDTSKFSGGGGLNNAMAKVEYKTFREVLVPAPVKRIEATTYECTSWGGNGHHRQFFDENFIRKNNGYQEVVRTRHV